MFLSPINSSISRQTKRSPTEVAWKPGLKHVHVTPFFPIVWVGSLARCGWMGEMCPGGAGGGLVSLSGSRGGVGLHSVLGSGSSGLGSPGVPSPASASGGGWVPPPVLRPAAASLLSLVFPPLLALPGGYRGPLPLGSGVGVCGVPAGVVSAWSRTVPSVVLCWGGGGLRASLVWPERHGYSGVDVG